MSGTVFADGRPRIVNIKGIRMDAEFGPSMIYITNLDKPGFIGNFSSTLGEAGINIATFHVGREAPGGNAVALIEIDGELPADVLGQGARAAAGAAGQAAAVLKFVGKISLLSLLSGAIWGADFGLPRRRASFIRRWTWPVAPGSKCPGAGSGKGS